MRMLNEAIEDAARFRALMDRIPMVKQGPIGRAGTFVPDPEVAEWNARIDREKAEKALRKANAKG